MSTRRGGAGATGDAQQQQEQQDQRQQRPLRAVITGSRLKNEHTEYRLELCAGAAKLSSVGRRFREFDELHAQLTKHKHAFEIPPMPPKKFFGRTNPDFVAKRQRDLQAFLDLLVARIVANPPAEVAWRLLCLFLDLDPKQFVPESILEMANPNAAGQAAGRRTGTAPAGPGGTGTGTAPSDAARADQTLDAASAFDSSGGGMLAVPDADGEALPDQQTLEAEDLRRMEAIVDAFARETINVSRNMDERLQHPPPAFLAKVPLEKLAESIRAHILKEPFPVPATTSDWVASPSPAAEPKEGAGPAVLAGGSSNDSHSGGEIPGAVGEHDEAALGAGGDGAHEGSLTSTDAGSTAAGSLEVAKASNSLNSGEARPRLEGVSELIVPTERLEAEAAESKVT